MSRRGQSVFRVSVRGAGRVAAQFDRDARRIQDEIVAELRQFGREAQEEFRRAAPRDTGDLRERITAVAFFGRAARPRISIRVRPDLQGHEGDKTTAFDYLTVSREGHRSAQIRARNGPLKVHVAGHRNAEIFEFRESVRGARPRADWVLDGAQRCERASAIAERRLARRIESRVLR